MVSRDGLVTVSKAKRHTFLMDTGYEQVLSSLPILEGDFSLPNPGVMSTGRLWDAYKIVKTKPIVLVNASILMITPGLGWQGRSSPKKSPHVTGGKVKGSKNELSSR
ncbi:MAG: hypothetical protein IMZ40_01615 [Bacilli bacterium]|nr:hypothetical protein [Bacilli bacterium]